MTFTVKVVVVWRVNAQRKEGFVCGFRQTPSPTLTTQNLKLLNKTYSTQVTYKILEKHFWINASFRIKCNHTNF